MNYVEEVDKAYDEFQDVYWDFERLVRTTDSLREPDRHLLLIALGELSDLVELLSELPTADSNGRYIEEDFVIRRIRDATVLLRKVKGAILGGNSDSLAEEELDIDIRGYVVYVREELLDMLKRALESQAGGVRG
jgi:hypothetical protein